MKRYFLPTMMLACMTLIAASCQDDNTTTPDGTVDKASKEETLYKLYPDASNITWSVKGNYAVADFSADTSRYTAWLDNAGNWYMTESDMLFEQLPQAVKEAFNSSEYATGRVDDVDKIFREGAETVYVIEVEGAQNGVKTEIDLYYSEDGVLVKSVVDADDDYDYSDFIPAPSSGSIEEFIAKNYPAAHIVDIDSENGMTEVEILDRRICRELLFNASNEWVHTKTEITLADVPTQVMEAFKASSYANYYIDDIDYYETPTENYYRFDLKSAAGDVKINIGADGKMTEPSSQPGIDGNQENGGMLDAAVKNFILEKYPTAQVLEYDYDDGLLEVEIWHENKEKNVYFNGAKDWVRTEWDITRNELPTAVTNTVEKQYAGFSIDDIEYVQTPTGDYYRIELERGDNERELRIDAAGKIL